MFKTIIPESEYTLPSSGLLYDYNKVLIRSMTGSDELYLMSNSVTNALNKIISACVKDSDTKKPIDPEVLCAADKIYCIMMIRAITYGDGLAVKVACDSCNKDQEFSIPLGSLNINYLTKDILSSLEFKLAENEDNSGLSVKLRIISDTDSAAISKSAKKIANKTKANADEYSRLLNIIRRIDTLSYFDEEQDLDITLSGSNDADVAEIEMILRSLGAKDLNILRNKIDECYNFGIELESDIECPNCGASNRIGVSIYNPEFFRPTTD